MQTPAKTALINLPIYLALYLFELLQYILDLVFLKAAVAKALLTSQAHNHGILGLRYLFQHMVSLDSVKYSCFKAYSSDPCFLDGEQFVAEPSFSSLRQAPGSCPSDCWYQLLYLCLLPLPYEGKGKNRASAPPLPSEQQEFLSFLRVLRQPFAWLSTNHSF